MIWIIKYAFVSKCAYNTNDRFPAHYSFNPISVLSLIESCQELDDGSLIIFWDICNWAYDETDYDQGHNI